MFNSEPNKLTDLSQVFLEPTNATHRQYEALRAFFVDGLPGVEVARRFGYTPGSFRVLVHQFRQRPRRDFFLIQGHRIKIGGLGRMANPAFGENLGFCGTSSHLFTMFVVALVIVNKYNIYVHCLVTIENLRKLRKK